MARPRLLNPMARASIAKSYLTGVPVSEIAKRWGVSMSNVINWAREYEHEMMERKLRSFTARERRANARLREIEPPPLEMPEPPASAYKVEKRISVPWKNRGEFQETRTSITLPRVSIQHVRDI